MMTAHADHTEVVVNDSAKQETLAKDSLVSVKKVAKPAIHKTFENVSFDKIIAEIAILASRVLLYRYSKHQCKVMEEILDLCLAIGM